VNIKAAVAVDSLVLPLMVTETSLSATILLGLIDSEEEEEEEEALSLVQSIVLFDWVRERK
jgi:hypothetical protein